METINEEKYFLGIDLHKRIAVWVLINEKGKIVCSFKIPVKDTDTKEAIKRLPTSLSPITVATEPVCGFRTYMNILESAGLQVVLSNPSQMDSISKSHKKNDKNDAYALANALRMNNLDQSYRPTNEEIAMRNLCRERAYYVRIRTSFINRINMTSTREGYDLDEQMPKSLRTIIGREFLAAKENNEIKRMLRAVPSFDAYIARCEKEMLTIAKSSKDFELLQTIPPIGPITALTILAEIGDINRFSNIKKFQSFSGLAMKERSSADKTRFLGIHKRGPRALRTTLVEAACRVRSENAGVLYAQHTNLMRNLKSPLAERTALARKILCAAYGVLKTKTPYKGCLRVHDERSISDSSKSNENHKAR